MIKPGKDYLDLITTIKGISGSWCHLEESVWLTKTGSTATSTSIRDTIQGATDSNDKLFVAEVTGDSMAWRNLSDEISDWIKSNFAG